MNNNKYLQDTRIELKSVWYDDEGNIRYTYSVPVFFWNKNTKRMDTKSVVIYSKDEYNYDDEVKIKSNKNNITGEIYYVIYKEQEENEENEILPF